jgi:hypothetical protein
MFSSEKISPRASWEIQPSRIPDIHEEISHIIWKLSNLEGLLGGWLNL